MELGGPAWQGGISIAEKQDLESIQKCAAHIILGADYTSYQDALETLQLDSLEHRRNSLALRFAIEAEKHKAKQVQSQSVNTRAKIFKYCDMKANHSRFVKSPLSFLTRILNKYYYKNDWVDMYIPDKWIIVPRAQFKFYSV